MLITLIPYFLTANLAVNESAWKDGPQYSYSMVLYQNSTKISNPPQEIAVVLKTHLLCQPKSPDTLRCQFNAMDGHNYKTGSYIVPMEDLPFEVKFNEQGVEHLVIPGGKSEHNWRVYLMKSVVDLLNFGTDFANKLDDNFSEYKNSTLGECLANYHLKRSPLDDKAEGNVDFELELVSAPDKVLEQGIELTMEVDFQNCKSQTFQFYEDLKDLDSRILTLESKAISGGLTITDKTFKSFSIASFMVAFNHTDEIRQRANNKLFLNLESIGPAEEKFHDIESPKITSLRLQ